MKISNSHKIRTLATLECFVQNIRQIEGRSRLWTVFDEFFVTFRFFFFLAKFLSKTCSDTRYCRCKGYFCSFGKATLAYLYSILPKIILARRSLFCRLRNVYFLGMILPLIFCLKNQWNTQAKLLRQNVPWAASWCSTSAGLGPPAVSKIYSSNTNLGFSHPKRSIERYNDVTLLPTTDFVRPRPA